MRHSKKSKNSSDKSNFKERSVRNYQKRNRLKKNNSKRKLIWEESNRWNGKKNWLARYVLISTISLSQWYLAFIIFVRGVFLDGSRSQKSVHNVERKLLRLWRTQRLPTLQLFIYKTILKTIEIRKSRKNLINKICSQQTFMISKRNQRIEWANSF